MKKPITANSVVQDVVSCAYLELLEEEDGWDACREVRSETKPIDFLLFFRVIRKTRQQISYGDT